MKIAILTAFNQKYKDIADVTLPLMNRYAQTHGYGLHIGNYHEDATRLETYGDRGKIDLYLSHYDEHDILVWLDVDVLVMNSAVKVDAVLGGRPFLWTYDHNGPCSGFWIARCEPRVTVMFNKVRDEARRGRSLLVSEAEHPHRVTLQVEPRGTSDQMMMRELMGIPPYSHVLKYCVSCKEAGHCFDYRALSMPPGYDYLGHYSYGDWLLTFPSLPLDQRLALLKENAAKAR